MPKVATSDSHERLTFRGYFWSYSASELAENFQLGFDASSGNDSTHELVFELGTSTWRISGEKPACVFGRVTGADSLDEAQLLTVTEGLRGPWRIEWLDDEGRVTREYSSEC